MCLHSSGNYTHVETQNWEYLEKYSSSTIDRPAGIKPMPLRCVIYVYLGW